MPVLALKCPPFLFRVSLGFFLISLFTLRTVHHYNQVELKTDKPAPLLVDRDLGSKNTSFLLNCNLCHAFFSLMPVHSKMAFVISLYQHYSFQVHLLTSACLALWQDIFVDFFLHNWLFLLSHLSYWFLLYPVFRVCFFSGLYSRMLSFLYSHSSWLWILYHQLGFLHTYQQMSFF